VRRHAATAVVLALLVGTAVAFAETERLKLKPTPIEESFVEPAFSPVCSCPQATAAIRLRLHKADTVTVRITDDSGKVIRVLTEGRRLPQGRTELAWDGRDGAGTRTPDGRYRVEVDLADAGKTFTLPQTVTLDTHDPTARLVSFRPEAADVGQRVRVSYRVSEPAHGVLFVNGRRRVVTYTRNRAAELNWRPRRTGSFRLQLAALDLAGNLGPLTPVFVVRVS
jgi:hypothetical protein